jgi:ATP-dependent Clp protease ATP-binding subunit ClpA
MNLFNNSNQLDFSPPDENYESANVSEMQAEEDAKGPGLEVYGTDLTILARQGKIEQCFGRQQELLELMEILVRRQKNNPVLVGDAGVGKTAIIELFATKIINNLVPFILEGRTIVSIDLTKIVAGSRYRGEFEFRLQRVLNEALNQPNVILFIDEIHNILGAGSAEGSMDAANILKPVLSRSGFQCIGASTTVEYQRIEDDAALNRRFQPIRIKEPSVDETVKILYGLRPGLEAYHNVVIMPGALNLAADLASRYIYDRFLPDKAIDLVDRAAAKEVIRLTNVTEGSVIAAVVNAGLNHIGALRLEAFRRGDIPVEFIFQEIENAHRNFLLRWIETPSEVPEVQEQVELLSPLSQDFFDTMRLSVLRRVDQLLFASSNPRSMIRPMQRVRDLSEDKNADVFNSFAYKVMAEEPVELSTYRISLYIYKAWIQIQSVPGVLKDEMQEQILSGFEGTMLWKMFRFTLFTMRIPEHLYHLRSEINRDPYFFSRENDYCEEDVEFYEQQYELLSELEETRIEVFKDYLKGMRPLLRKGIIESLRYSSQIKMTNGDMTLIYTLLGYFSTETGHLFLANLEDPELIQRARRLGDFSGLKKRITQKEIRELLAHMTGIPVQSLSNRESKKLVNLEATLHSRVIGQEEAVSAISKAIRRSRLGIQNPNRPIASFLFCGPTGVGKTEVTKALAVSMFGNEDDMIRFDMSEFMEKFAVSRLVGAPAGYVGYEDGGQLSDAVRRKPYSVVLFDEIEKAHPDILNILLQILEDGRLTDTKKRLVAFENTVIIMTSNAGAEDIQQLIKSTQLSSEGEIKEEGDGSEEKNGVSVYNDPYSGAIEFLKSPITESFLSDIRVELEVEFEKSFRTMKNYELLNDELNEGIDSKTLTYKQRTSKELAAELKKVVLDRLSNIFLPEFLNRLDDIIVFQPLRPEELRKICNIMIQGVAKRIKEKNIILNVDDRVKAKLTKEGYNPLFGARPLRRLVTKYIEDLISENLLENPGLDSKTPRVISLSLNEEGKIAVKSE